MEKISNFLKAMLSALRTYLKGGEVKASPDVIEQRSLVCSLCPLQGNYGDFEICTDCGCVLHIKRALLNEKCPKGKW